MRPAVTANHPTRVFAADPDNGSFGEAVPLA
jgi:hypothetical protein